MDTGSAGFPRELLSQPWPARLGYFRAYTMAHPRLLAARETLLSAIHEMAPNSLILLMGPTGVGKTTLRAKVEQMLTTEMLPERSSSASGTQGRSGRPASGLWVSHLPAHPGVGPGGEQLRPKTRARTASSLQHQDHTGHLCPGHHAGQTGSAGDVPRRIVEGSMDGEKNGDKLGDLAPGPHFVGILWAGAIRGNSDKCFEMMVARDGVEPPTPAFSGLRSTS